MPDIIRNTATVQHELLTVGDMDLSVVCCHWTKGHRPGSAACTLEAYIQILIEPYTKYKLMWSWFFIVRCSCCVKGWFYYTTQFQIEGVGLVHGVIKLIMTFSAFET